MWAIFSLLLSVIVYIAATTIGVGLIVPFVGIVVRFRVNYNPKGFALGGAAQTASSRLGDSIGLAPDGTEEARVVGPRVTSLLGMLLRVRRLEGWRGLWKGFMPLYIYTGVNTVFSLLYLGARMSSAPKGSYGIPRASLFQSLVWGVFTSMTAIPFGIIANRAITTPHNLPTFSPRTSLRLLLTSYERRRPWVLYLTPGLVSGQMLHVFFIALISRLVRLLLVPSLADGIDGAEEDGTIANISSVRLSIFILFQALAGTALLSPLEVMTERLAIQRNYTPGAEFEEEDAELAAAQANGPTGSGVTYAAQEEDVLNLRSNSGEEPYKGLRHCLTRIVEEEGVTTLFRAWWLTMLGAVLSGLA
ncbi:hypothetical protein FRB96_005023 [Tulasnella sp. 330]|nr:hypothetical protein FRB96_005023 [Tulasnella sp. 330]KAG8878172.1 hypothetical protein FRB97_002723 [Tulasnella sp. 331]KAG8883532.1 hypothetical protein FRB98_003093 [Tulasnella sp. 332]